MHAGVLSVQVKKLNSMFSIQFSQMFDFSQMLDLNCSKKKNRVGQFLPSA